MGEKVPQTYRNSVNMAALGVDSVLPSPGNRRRAITTNTRREGESGEEWGKVLSGVKSTGHYTNTVATDIVNPS